MVQLSAGVLSQDQRPPRSVGLHPCGGWRWPPTRPRASDSFRKPPSLTQSRSSRSFTTSDLFARFADRLAIAFLPAATLFLPAPRSNPAATPAAAAMNLAESTLEYTFRRRVPLAAAGGAR